MPQDKLQEVLANRATIGPLTTEAKINTMLNPHALDTPTMGPLTNTAKWNTLVKAIEDKWAESPPINFLGSDLGQLMSMMLPGGGKEKIPAFREKSGMALDVLNEMKQSPPTKPGSYDNMLILHKNKLDEFAHPTRQPSGMPLNELEERHSSSYVDLHNPSYADLHSPSYVDLPSPSVFQSAQLSHDPVRYIALSRSADEPEHVTRLNLPFEDNPTKTIYTPVKENVEPTSVDDAVAQIGKRLRGYDQMVPPTRIDAIIQDLANYFTRPQFDPDPKPNFSSLIRRGLDLLDQNNK